MNELDALAIMVEEATRATYEPPDALVEEVRKACAQPINVLQVTALLESAGVTDTIARRRYGYTDVFALAESMAERFRTTPAEPAPPPKTEVAPEDWKTTLIDYGRGPMGLLPLILLTVLINLYQNFGQWDSSRILTLSISTVSSLLATGGFVQIAARKGSSYLSQGYIRAAGRVIFQIMGLCLAFVLSSSAALTFFVRAIGLLAREDQGLMVTAYITLSCLWMFSAVLALLNLTHWFVIALGVGVASAYIGITLLLHAGLPSQTVMLIATVTSLLITTAVMAMIIQRTLKIREAASPVGDHQVILAPLPQLFVSLAPYFAYGVIYVICVLAGHVGGWIGRLPAGMARPQGLAASELALTLALTGYILVGGVAERTMRRFWQRVNIYQKQVLADNPRTFGDTLRDFIKRERTRFVWALSLCSALVLVIIVGAASAAPDGILLGLRWDPATLFIFVTGLIGYGILAFGVFDCMFIITLSRPLYALAALGIGTLATLVISIIAGILVSYAYGALGVPLGSLVFSLFARRYLTRIIRYADYYYYASF